MPLLGYPKIIPSWNFEPSSWDHLFLSYAPNISVKNALFDLVTLKPQIHVASRTSQLSRSFPIPNLNTLSHSFLAYAPDKQTDGLEHPTHADRKSQRGLQPRYRLGILSNRQLVVCDSYKAICECFIVWIAMCIMLSM